MEMIQVLTRLVEAFGPSGCEHQVSQVIEELARPYVDEISRDTLGNLICHKKGSGPKVMFSAHMDSIGLVATHIDEKGFVRVGALGGVSAKEVAYTPVRFQNGTCGLIWVSAVPAFLCLIRFWEICESIRKDRSFSMENALRLKRMSQYMLADTILYTGFLAWFFLAGWYVAAAWLIFPVLLAIFISVALTVLCAVLSHLVQKAEEIQEEQELTI